MVLLQLAALGEKKKEWAGWCSLNTECWSDFGCWIGCGPPAAAFPACLPPPPPCLWLQWQHIPIPSLTLSCQHWLLLCGYRILWIQCCLTARISISDPPTENSPPEKLHPSPPGRQPDRRRQVLKGSSNAVQSSSLLLQMMSVRHFHNHHVLWQFFNTLLPDCWMWHHQQHRPRDQDYQGLKDTSLKSL